ncbi:MAG: MarR family transcriptional regulator [Chloroflexi bacterium]|nr:MarR family transcriptional regulator [Chloroflexota bacterium]
MGSTWGINRTVAQIYALLYLAPEPLTAEEISTTLSVARSTVSTGLRELQGWGIVKSVHALGDRRDHFETMSDVWELFRAIVNEHKRRAIDPTLGVLRESVADIQGSDEPDHVKDNLQEMLNFFETITTIYSQVEQMPTSILLKIAKLGDRFSNALSVLAKE